MMTDTPPRRPARKSTGKTADSAPAARSGGTRDAIVDQAIRLFNDRGSTAVTTNHIAAELRISPGNLYYHFRNKEEIVRDAYARYCREADAALEPSALAAGDPAAILAAYVTGTVALIQRWPFFFEDMAELCRRDAALAQDLKQLQRRWVAHLGDVLRRLRAAGLLRAEVQDGDLDMLAAIVWMVARSSLEYARNAADGDLTTDAAIRRGVRPIFAAVRPYLADAMRDSLDRLVDAVADSVAESAAETVAATVAATDGSAAG